MQLRVNIFHILKPGMEISTLVIGLCWVDFINPVGVVADVCRQDPVS
jgi:hypothetical protein